MTILASTNPQEAKLADTSENPQEVRLAISKSASPEHPEPAPQLNGRLLKHPDRPEIFLIVDGSRRHVVDKKTMDTLFVTNREVKPEYLIDHIIQGPDLESGAMTVKGDGGDPWYFLPGGMKMWIRDKTIFAQYQFRAVTVYPQIVINAIPKGPDLQGRGPQ